jgi:methenyltetrahydromethanopterin cyclohydrolase
VINAKKTVEKTSVEVEFKDAISREFEHLASSKEEQYSSPFATEVLSSKQNINDIIQGYQAPNSILAEAIKNVAIVGH